MRFMQRLLVRRLLVMFIVFYSVILEWRFVHEEHLLLIANTSILLRILRNQCEKRVSPFHNSNLMIIVMLGDYESCVHIFCIPLFSIVV